METRKSWSTRRLEKHRVQWKGQVGDILRETKSEYFVRFGIACQFIPKTECVAVYGMKRETN